MTTITAELLFTNDAFYLAFHNRDFESMDRLWARRVAVSCTHPGWKTLEGRAQVMASWEGIFEHAASPAIIARAAQARGRGDAGLVTCYEVLGDTVLSATNVFFQEQGKWRIVHHHASQCREAPPGVLVEEEVSLQ